MVAKIEPQTIETAHQYMIIFMNIKMGLVNWAVAME